MDPDIARDCMLGHLLNCEVVVNVCHRDTSDALRIMNPASGFDASFVYCFLIVRNEFDQPMDILVSPKILDLL